MGTVDWVPIDAAIRKKQRIPAIREYRDQTHESLRESRIAVDARSEEIGVAPGAEGRRARAIRRLRDIESQLCRLDLRNDAAKEDFHVAEAAVVLLQRWLRR